MRPQKKPLKWLFGCSQIQVCSEVLADNRLLILALPTPYHTCQLQEKKKCTNCVTKFLIKLWSMSNFEIKALCFSEINLQQLNNLTFDLWCDNRSITLVSTECSVILFSANDKCTPAKIFKLNIPFITI